MESVVIYLLDKNQDVQYGLNWGQRENRDPNQAYLQLSPEIYKGDFFPIKGKYFIVDTDDGKILIFNRAQKDYGSALQTPENNSIIGEYLRERMGVPLGSEITKEHIASYGRNTITIYKRDDMHYLLDFSNKPKSFEENISRLKNYLAAMRTKPFLLLAGISGTGKSRIVKEMAFASCPPSLRKDKVTPGNYCMIEVKPNWHDSTELMGYESKIGGDHYVVTPFINFLIKAMHYPKAPFFVCLDEMNLAPVEQYFAEFLSVLESRKRSDDGTIVSEPLIKPEIFSKTENFESFKKAYYRGALAPGGLVPEDHAELWKELGDNGLRLPPNVIVVGTVNMDETTYQFSRKVIDRAMTIEMNEVNFNKIFDSEDDTLAYRDPYVGAQNFLPKYAAAKDALIALRDEDGKNSRDDVEYLTKNIPAILNSLDAALSNTPFRIAYRVENELILYFAALREEQSEATSEALLAKAVDDILMMKVLPRIEGDEALLGDDNDRRGPLSLLLEFTAQSYPKAHKKVLEMKEKLEANHFTSFWP